MSTNLTSTPKISISKWLPWVLATRPKTLTAAFVPVLVGTMLAYADMGSVNWEISIYALLASFFIQMGTNLINDALDFKKGADTSSRLGPARATQMGLLTMTQVFSGGMMCFGVAFLFGIPLMIQGGWPIGIIFSLSVLCGYLYTGGPMPLAYSGLGDLFVLIFFGLVATTSVYYLQTGIVTSESILAGAQIGFLAMVMIAVNNLRDVVGDAKVNKKTLAVRFGKTFARMEISTLILLAFALNYFWILHGYLLAGVLSSAVLPIGTFIIKGVWNTNPSSVYNRFLGLSAATHLGFGVLLAIGFYLG